MNILSDLKATRIRSAQDPFIEPFQQRVQPWLNMCFGSQIAADTEERNNRFLEEAVELVQACGATRADAHQLVDYVFDRPVGERGQEVGGVMMTLAALCLAQKLDMHAEGDRELLRVWGKIDEIRAKQAAKPKNSPLPIAQPTAPTESMLSAQDLADLERLNDLFDDGMPYDLPKDRMQHLCKLGVIRHVGGGYYAISAFGRHCGDPQWGLPLRTVEQINADQDTARAELQGANP